jgi:hypothetical protein
MDAVIRVEYGGGVPSAPAAAPGEKHLFSHFAIDGMGVAQWGLKAKQVARSRVVALQVRGALSVGIEIGGWINRVEDCNVNFNSIGIKFSGNSNANVIQNNNLEGNRLAGIVVGFGDGGVVITGNEIEGTGGPAIVVLGDIHAINIVNNYFEGNSVGYQYTHEPGFVYGPLNMRPKFENCGNSEQGPCPLAKNITVVGEIVLNGCFPNSNCDTLEPSLSAAECISVYCREYPLRNVKVSGNYFALNSDGTTKINTTQNMTIAWGAVIDIATVGLDVSDNYGQHSTVRDWPPPLLVGGTDPDLFMMMEVHVSGNTGFQASIGCAGGSTCSAPLPGHTTQNPHPGTGWVSLLNTSMTGSTDLQGCMDYYTVVAEGLEPRNLLGSALPTCLLQPKAVDGMPVPTVQLVVGSSFEGKEVFEWVAPKASALLLGELPLQLNPSAANRSVVVAVHVQSLAGATIEFLIDRGDGEWARSRPCTAELNGTW